MKTRKAINFDLSTNDLKQFFNDTREPYNQIKAFMLENGFEHRQYSGYVSKEPMDTDDILNFADKIRKHIVWLKNCVKEFDVTDIGEQHSLKDLITSPMQSLTKDVNKSIDKTKAYKPSQAKIEAMRDKMKKIAKNLQNNRAANLSKNNKDIER